jgi:hypothetical protein
LEDTLTDEQINLYRAIARCRIQESLSKSSFQGKTVTEARSDQQPFFGKYRNNTYSLPMTKMNYFDQLGAIPKDDFETHLAASSQTRFLDVERGMLFRFHGHMIVPKIDLLLRDYSVFLDRIMYRVALEDMRLNVEGNSGQIERCHFCIDRLSAFGANSKILATDHADDMNGFLKVDAKFIGFLNNRDATITPALSPKSPCTIELKGGLGKVTLTVEEEEMKGILHFIGELGQFFHPVPVLQQHSHERLRKTALAVIDSKNYKKLNTEMQQAIVWNTHISFQGFELVIPINKYNLDAAYTVPKWPCPRQNVVCLHFTFEWAQLSSGSFLDLDGVVQHWVNDESYATSKRLSAPRLKQQAMKLGLLVSRLPKDLYRHFVSY